MTSSPIEVHARAGRTEGSPRAFTPWSRLDLLFGAILLLTGVLTGTLYVRHYSGTPSYYQDQFGPAVMVATGHGFVDPHVDASHCVSRFLRQETESLSRQEARTNVGVSPPTAFQWRHVYLLHAAGYLWSITGVSWASLSWLSGLMFGASLALSFVLFRFVTGRWSAVAAAAFYAFSALHLTNLPHVRDYSKAPFTLAGLVIIGCILSRGRGARQLVALATMGGVLVGIGYGFRSDVSVLLPLIALSLISCASGTGWRGTVAAVSAIGTLGVVFLLVASPVLRANSKAGSNSFHVVVLGLAPLFDDYLGLETPNYVTVRHYDDAYAAAVVQSYSERTLGRRPLAYSKAYDEACRRFLVEHAMAFPADMATRIAASSWRIAESGLQGYGDPQLNAPTVSAVYRGVAAALQRLRGLGGVAVVLSVVILLGKRDRVALVLVLMGVALLAYPAAQFHPRHYFHLSLTTPLALLFVSRWAARAYTTQGQWARAPWKQAARRALPVVVAAAAVLAVYVGAATAQSRQVRGVVTRALATATDPVPVVASSPADGEVLLTSVAWDEGGRRDRLQTDYLVVRFSGLEPLRTAHELSFPVTFVYEAASRERRDYTVVVDVGFTRGVRCVLHPVYYGRLDGFTAQPLTATFRGIRLPLSALRYVRDVSRIRLDSGLSLLPAMVLSHDWAAQAWRQRSVLPAAERRRKTRVYAHPDDLMFEQPEALAALNEVGNVGTTQVATTDPRFVTGAPGQLNVDGVIDPAASVVKLADVRIDATRFLVVSGTVHEGGFGLGVLREGRWHRQIVVSDPGRFAVVVRSGEPGLYSAAISGLPGGNRPARLAIESMGWR